MASAVKPSWGSYAILAYALLLECLFVRPSSAGSFSNCCNITRCKNVTAVCSDYEPCASACLSHLSGRAKGSPPLPVVDCQDQAVLSLLDYGCMARTLNGTGAAPSLVDDVCGQKYRPGLAPAAPLYVSFATCVSDCGDRDPLRVSSAGALTLLTQYIIPVVVFCVTIPRRRRWEASPRLFDFGRRGGGGGAVAAARRRRLLLLLPGRLLLSLSASAVVIVVDMFVWVMTVFVLAGAVLVGPLAEAFLDFEITRHLEDTCVTHTAASAASGACLTVNERIELIVVLLCGNLDLDGGSVDPAAAIKTALQIPETTSSRVIRDDSKGAAERAIRFRLPDYSLPRSPRADSAPVSDADIQQADNNTPPVPAPPKASITTTNTTITTATIEEEEKLLVARHRQHQLLLLRTTQHQLKCILRAQATFGSLVGAAVLFFLGSFAVTLQSLSGDVGDNATAHSLAFGMWWVVVVHVAIVASCTLASHNPSTVAGVVGFNPARRGSLTPAADPEFVDVDRGHNHHSHHPRHHRHDHASGGRRAVHRGSGASRLASDGASLLGMKPVYNSPFVPVTLWDRGRMKKRWLEGTAAWRHEWFRKRVKIRLGWFLIPAFAFLLILIPTSLAFTISYTTPRTCLGCRSLVFLVYTCAQVPIIAASTWWTYRSDTDPIRTIRGTLRSPTALSVALLLVSAFVAALVLGASLFASFTGTVLQLTGTLSNCVCSIPAASWLSRGRLGELINLASDTAQHRMWSFLWSACGYATVSFMAVMTYLGWWCQMVLRRKLYVEISKLSEGLELGRD